MNRRMRAVVIFFLPGFFPNADSFQPKVSVRSFHQHSKSINFLYNDPETTEILNPQDDNKKESTADVMESLDVVLQRARKRKPSWMLRGVAFLNSPIAGVAWMTNSDIALVIIALSVGSYGFCAGYSLGKWMGNSQNQIRLRNLAGDSIHIKPWQQALFFQYWPVILAIVLDQATSFLF